MEIAWWLTRGCRTISREFVTFLFWNNLKHFVETRHFGLLGSDETPRRVEQNGLLCRSFLFLFSDFAHFECDLSTFFSSFYSSHFSCKTHTCKMLALPLQKTHYYQFILYIFINHFACLYFFSSTNFSCALCMWFVNFLFFPLFRTFLAKCMQNASAPYTLYMWFANFLFFLLLLQCFCIPHTFLAKCMQNASAPIAENALMLILYYIFLYTILHAYTSLLLQIFLAHFASDLSTCLSSSHFSCKSHAKC